MIIPLDKASKYEFSLVGGKGHQLGRLLDLGLNVPDGFIISTQYYGRNWEEIDEEIKENFNKRKFDLVAVRSSGNIEDSENLSFAGLLSTELNIREEGLESAVRKIWSAKNSPNVELYLNRFDIPLERLEIAVIIQNMIKAQFSGVAFGANPVTGNKDELVIEVVEGAGQGLVSGSITPNTYYLDKGPLSVKSSNIENHTVDEAFSNEIRKTIAQNLLRVEESWDRLVDLEWVVRENQVYVVQARPVTTF